jgi:DNA-binding transcriptional regulator YiaG
MQHQDWNIKIIRKHGKPTQNKPLHPKLKAKQKEKDFDDKKNNPKTNSLSPKEIMQARQRLGLSQQQMAMATCVTIAQVKSWESGSQPLRGQHLAKIKKIIWVGRGSQPESESRE